ncbi:hypothetical protein GRI89_15455 [Altererythrobacter salegens]|uniref:Conjugal transfer pilus assembly protein TraV n=1 Tax=Croceibacterium salegens TaxID=1737568 RepID=A0A6I4SZY4_9SPHN|nr:hypothetical protein [Croceibacterium salegens]
MTGGCSTLGGNVSGDFACRAPEGSCAPTTLIDAAATGMDAQVSAVPTPSQASASANGQSLRIVLAAWRDEAGRTHEARVVHVTLPEPASTDWRAPHRTGEVLRAIGNSIADGGSGARPTHYETPEQEPEMPLPPWQPVPASPGASAPVIGAPVGPMSTDRVPHPPEPQGDEE